MHDFGLRIDEAYPPPSHGRRDEIRNGWIENVSERHFQGFPLAMLIAQMTVGFHAQRAAVLVPKPAGDRWNVNASLNAACCEQMAQVMMCDAFYVGQFRGPVDGFLTLEYLHHRPVGRFFGPLRTHLLKQLSQTAVQRNPPVLAVFCDADVEQTFLKIHIVPNNMSCFIDSRARESEKPEQVRAVLRLACTGGFDMGRHFLKFRLGG